MTTSVPRQTVDLSAYPDLVVIYLGLRVSALRGLKTIVGLGPQIQKAGDAKPEGLLHSEQNIIYRMFPFEIGMRWYWRDFESMEAWTRSPPHREWWKQYPISKRLRRHRLLARNVTACAVGSRPSTTT